MNRREQRRELRARKQAVRAAVAKLRREARERMSQIPAVRRERMRRRIRRTSALLALLLLALFVRCDCAEAPVPVAPVVTASPVVAKPKPPPTPPAKPEVFSERIKPQRRGRYEATPRPPPSWLEAFHLQVAARSPRLAECFRGSERPGALRWAAALNAKSGAVSDHELEPLGAGGSFTQEQRDCVIGALSTPQYQLKVPAPDALPRRVGLVIEF